MEGRTIGHKFKELGKHGLVYGVGTALESMLNFLLIPLFLNRFTPQVFGAFSLIQLTAAMAGAFFYFGGSSALSRFFFDAQSEHERKRRFTVSFHITLVGALILSLIAFLGGKPISTALFGDASLLKVFIYMMLYAGCSMLNTNFYILIRLLKKSFWFILLKLLSLSLSLGAIIFLINRMDNIAEATALGYLAGQLIVLVIMALRFRFYLLFEWNIALVRRFLTFGIPIAVSGLLYAALDWTIRYFVNRELGARELGLFSMGIKLGALIQAGFILPFSLIWSTIRMEYRDDDNTHEFFNKVATYFLQAGIGIVFIISILIDLVIRFLANNANYEGSLAIIPVMLLSQLAWGTVNILDYGLYINNKTVYYILYDLAALCLATVLSVTLLKYTGVAGAALVNFSSYFLIALLIYLRSNRYFKITIDLRALGITVLLAAVLFAISQALHPFTCVNTFLELVKDLGLVSVFVTASYLLVTREEKSKIREFIQTVRNRF